MRVWPIQKVYWLFRQQRGIVGEWGGPPPPSLERDLGLVQLKYPASLEVSTRRESPPQKPDLS